MDPTQPDLATLVKIGSALVHAEEAFESLDKKDDNAFVADRGAFATVAQDPAVKAWVALMTGMALLPVKR